jgi:hypothetical protein
MWHRSALLFLVATSCTTGGEGEGELVIGEGEGEEGEGEEGEGEEGEGEAAGFGEISGDCGSLDDNLSSPVPSFVDNIIDFGSNGYDDPAERPQLTPGGAEIIIDGNAGGSSLWSEVFAYEVLARCEGAVLYKTETEVNYTAAGSITDLVIDIEGERYGVSVVRSFVFPPGTPLTAAEAAIRLQGKLDDILESTANVDPADAWRRQVLAVVAPEPDHIEVLRLAWQSLDPATQADTILYVTLTEGADEFLY